MRDINKHNLYSNNIEMTKNEKLEIGDELLEQMTKEELINLVKKERRLNNVTQSSSEFQAKPLDVSKMVSSGEKQVLREVRLFNKNYSPGFFPWKFCWL